MTGPELIMLLAGSAIALFVLMLAIDPDDDEDDEDPQSGRSPQGQGPSRHVARPVRSEPRSGDSARTHP